VTNSTHFRNASRRGRPKLCNQPTLWGTMEPMFTSISPPSIGAATRKRDAVLTVVAALMLAFGIAEAVAGFRHSLLTAHIPMATYLGAVMGVSYVFGAALIFTARKSAAVLALCLLAVVILGYVAMVVTDLYPTDSVSQLFAIVLRTSTACSFLVVVALKWETLV
jgi:hypothetical protein